MDSAARHNYLSEAVGKRRVKVVDEETGEEIGRGLLQAATFGTDDSHMNESEIVVAADLPAQSEQ